MASLFDAQFRTQSMPALIAQFGTEVEHWPGGDSVEGTVITVLISGSDEAGREIGGSVTGVDRRGQTANQYYRITVQPTVTVTRKDQFVLPTGVANAVRRMEGAAPMDTWLVCVPMGVDTTRARTRE